MISCEHYASQNTRPLAYEPGDFQYEVREPNRMARAFFTAQHFTSKAYGIYNSSYLVGLHRVLFSRITILSY